jgi:hypothetical protein
MTGAPGSRRLPPCAVGPAGNGRPTAPPGFAVPGPAVSRAGYADTGKVTTGVVVG